MQLERLKLFAELVKIGNFSRTAESLGVSKAYVSTQISLLEKALGKQLLIRNTRTMRLTSAGERLFQEADKLTAFWHNTKLLLEESEESIKGAIHFTAPTGIMRYCLLPVINSLTAHYPQVQVVCETGNQTHNLTRSHYDFAVRITNTPPQDMVAVKLFESDYVCCATPSYFEQYGKPTSPNELRQHACIALHYWNQWNFSLNGKVESIDVGAQQQYSDNDILKAAVLSGQGITRLPRYMIEQELKMGQLTALFEEQQAELRSVYLLYPHTSSRPARVTLLLDKIKAAFQAA